MAAASWARARRWAIVAAVVAGLGVVAGWLWQARNSGPMQDLFVYFGLMTGIDVQDIWDPPVRWHVKQTLSIETPQGDVTSSVVRAKVMGRNRLSQSAWSREQGEALVIEVSPGRYLFAVIEEFKPGEEKIFFPADSWVLTAAQKLHSVLGQVRDVPKELYPLMVTFGDLKDPKSVQEVDPFNLPATFGPGYKIKSYTVEITDEPVTVGRVAALLPWVVSLRGSIGKEMGLP